MGAGRARRGRAFPAQPPGSRGHTPITQGLNVVNTSSVMCRTAAAAAILLASWLAGWGDAPLSAASRSTRQPDSQAGTVVHVSSEAELQTAVASLTSRFVYDGLTAAEAGRRFAGFTVWAEPFRTAVPDDGPARPARGPDGEASDARR